MKNEEIPLTIGSFSLEAHMIVPLAIVIAVSVLVLVGAKRELATLAIGAVVIGAILAT